ncbi:hypothetical protein PE067_21210 [Paracoccus sp. DMF-8]|uniref:hypothetical protein n=1 Tax=Paracoccus sp. DMF-8 TaxID=3019445 RepID=UPI0023E41913|nr:hypothetical protein [Paracoccus sp. DMF-8]MDF3608442.1 hypothetical protein [Paracoccus sp. DMF-8]
MPNKRVESVCIRTGRPSSAGAAKFDTAAAKASEPPASSAGVTIGSTIPKRMRLRLAPAICPASSTSPFSEASAAAMTT